VITIGALDADACAAPVATIKTVARTAPRHPKIALILVMSSSFVLDRLFGHHCLGVQQEETAS
jgi:uncharacterized protein YaiI (UPF0178 family)